MQRWAIWASAGLLLVACETRAVNVAGVELPARRGDLTLHGAGLLRKGLIFKIYVGALYLARAEDAARILEDVPKQLDIHYFHHTPRKHMIRVAEKTLRRNLSPEQYATLAPQINALHVAYRDGRKGGYASLAYRPGGGLTYSVDGEAIVTVGDDRFANAYLQVWLGKYPSSVTIKEALLRQREDES